MVCGSIKLMALARTDWRIGEVEQSEFSLCHAEPFGDLRVNPVKHLLWTFRNSFAEQGKGKSGFFVATLLRMTHESVTGC